MVDFIELTNADRTGVSPVLVRKSQVVAIQPEAINEHDTCFVYLCNDEVFHVKQSYDEIKEQFKFE